MSSSVGMKKFPMYGKGDNVSNHHEVPSGRQIPTEKRESADSLKAVFALRCSYSIAMFDHGKVSNTYRGLLCGKFKSWLELKVSNVGSPSQQKKKPLVNVYITTENHHVKWENSLKMTIFHDHFP